MFLVLVCMIFAYLLGSISSSFIVGKLAAGVDIREHGSGNAGTTNILRVIGWRWALVVLAADLIKGVLAIAFAHLVTGGSAAAMALSGFAVVAGHNWPLYFGFRGGKGIATTIGVLITLSPTPALYAGLVGVALLILLRYVSLSALVFVTLILIFQIAMHTPGGYIWTTFAIAVMAYWRHRGNIERLMHGREPRIFS